jgi:hypothetical protein
MLGKYPRSRVRQSMSCPCGRDTALPVVGVVISVTTLDVPACGVSAVWGLVGRGQIHGSVEACTSTSDDRSRSSICSCRVTDLQSSGEDGTGVVRDGILVSVSGWTVESCVGGSDFCRLVDERM